MCRAIDFAFGLAVRSVKSENNKNHRDIRTEIRWVVFRNSRYGCRATSGFLIHRAASTGGRCDHPYGGENHKDLYRGLSQAPPFLGWLGDVHSSVPGP